MILHEHSMIVALSLHRYCVDIVCIPSHVSLLSVSLLLLHVLVYLLVVVGWCLFGVAGVSGGVACFLGGSGSRADLFVLSCAHVRGDAPRRRLCCVEFGSG